MKQIRAVPGAGDVRIQQSATYPQLKVAVDRDRLAQMGLTERDVTSGLSNALAGTSQVAPTFFLNPKSGITYPVVAQTPEYQVSALDSLSNVPIGNASSGTPQILGGLGTVTRADVPATVTRYNIAPAIDIYARPNHRDLGGVTDDVTHIVEKMRKSLPKGTNIIIAGQSETMGIAFTYLGFGLLAAIVLIYLIIVINFQSWLDPLIIIMALPAVLAGIVWMLFITGTTISVPALTGAIMAMGVATANSILVVSFAREQLAQHGDSVRAALEAAQVRLRPVLMTAMAMVIGMVPMALGWGEGGEQNAPLGRAVIGGLAFATVATLSFVPVLFSLIHARGHKDATDPASELLVHAHA